MKEIISALVIIASILGGTAALKGFHDTIREAALEKAAQGLPSLEGMSRTLSTPHEPIKKTDQSRHKGASKGGLRD